AGADDVALDHRVLRNRFVVERGHMDAAAEPDAGIVAGSLDANAADHIVADGRVHRIEHRDARRTDLRRVAGKPVRRRADVVALDDRVAGPLTRDLRADRKAFLAVAARPGDDVALRWRRAADAVAD